MDRVVTNVYRNSIMSKVAMIPRFAAKKVEDTNLRSDQTSANPISTAHGGRHTFVPFAMEDGGRIGAHGLAVLRMLAEHEVSKGKLPPRPRHAALPSPLVAVSLWVRRW